MLHRTRFSFFLTALLAIPAMASEIVTVTETPGTNFTCYRSSTKLGANVLAEAACVQRFRDDAVLRAPGTYPYRVEKEANRYAITVIATPPPPVPVPAVMSAWGPWVTSMTSTCVGNVQTVSETRSRTVVEPARNGGTTAALTEPRQRTVACVSAPSGTVPIPALPSNAGSSEFKISGTIGARTGNPGGAAFRIVCEYSHMGFNDPIVFPGQPGVSHLHTFFGNTSTNAFTTTESLTAANKSTCAGGTANLSSYWVPSMIATLINRALVPGFNNFYYKAHSGPTTALVTVPPNGLRMIAGNSPSETREVPTAHVWFSCSGANEGKSIPSCPAGSVLMVQVAFPDCWDGVNLDSPDHRSHMRYSDIGRCPASHPRLIPQITLNNWYDVGPGDRTDTWRLSSDSYVGPAGYSMHADVWLNWNEEIKAAFVINCVRANLDCDNYQVGDGRGMF